MLLSETYPKFLGQGKDSRSKRSRQRQATESDSGVESTSDSDEDSSTDHDHGHINDRYSMFAGEIPEDEIEVVEACHVGNEALIEVRFPEGKNMSSIECEEANVVAVMHKLGKHAAQHLFPGVDYGLQVMSVISGKSDGGNDNQCSMFDDGPVVDEEALIEEKTEYDKTYILKHRSIFSESLNPDRFIKAPPWKLP